MERMERNIIIERGECSCTHALEKVDELFGPAVSFRALTCIPLGCADDDWPDTMEVYQRLVAVAEMIGGNYPDVVIQGQDIIEVSYVSRLGNSEFRWAAGTYTVTCNPASSLLYNLLLNRQDCTEILTGGSGHCYLHRPDTAENPESCWVFAPEGGDWCHRYTSLDELIRSEAHDWLQVNGAIV